MKTSRSVFFKFVATLIIVMILALPVMGIAQETMEKQEEGTYAEGMMMGEMEGKGNPVWLVGGLGCGFFLLYLGTPIVLIAYLLPQNPPAARLIGKSSAWAMGYTEGYKKKSQNANAGYACGGLALGSIVSLLLYVSTE